MYWPDTNTGVDVEPTRKPVASAVRKFFTEGGVGQAPTVPGGDWFNQITNELLNVLAAAGIDPSKADDDQLLQAISRISKIMIAREALRMAYAAAGFDMVDGSFEQGGTVTNPNDVLLYEADGIAYLSNSLPRTVESNSTPNDEPGWDSIICPPGKEISLESLGDLTSEDAGALITKAISMGATRIICDTDCTMTTRPNIPSFCHVEMRCKVTWGGVSGELLSETVLPGVFEMGGSLVGSQVTRTLAAAVVEGDNTLKLDSVAGISKGEYWWIRPQASQWGPLSYMLQIADVDAVNNILTLSYRHGWPIASGAVYLMQKVNPVIGSSVYIKELNYQTIEGANDGVAGVARQYTVGCDVKVDLAYNTKWPVILNRWNMHGTSELGLLKDPQDVTTGGTGYGIHNIHGLYHHTKRARTMNARHVVDWSGCAYCVDEHCYDDRWGSVGTTSFSVHQAYDHDNTLRHFSGWLAWSNLPVFGQSMKRLRAEKGIAQGQLLIQNTSPECSFEDIDVFGDIVLVPDGTKLRNVVQKFGTTRWWQQVAPVSNITSEVVSSFLIPRTAADWIPAEVTAPIRFIGGAVGPMNDVVSRGTELSFRGTRLSSSPTPGNPSFWHTPKLSLDCDFALTPLRFLGVDMTIDIDGTCDNYSDTVNAFIDTRISSGVHRLSINPMRIRGVSTSAKLLNWPAAGGSLQLSMAAVTFDTGSVAINAASGMGPAGWMNDASTTYKNVALSRPAPSSTVAHSGELIIA